MGIVFQLELLMEKRWLNYVMMRIFMSLMLTLKMYDDTVFCRKISRPFL